VPVLNGGFGVEYMKLVILVFGQCITAYMCYSRVCDCRRVAVLLERGRRRALSPIVTIGKLSTRRMSA